jgi:GNAT superfamily N-acetyltransferase
MIRRAETTADFELCAAIHAEIEPVDRVTAEQLADAPGAFLVCGEDGYALVKRSSVGAYAMIRVRPAARGRGTGSALLAAVVEEARRLERDVVWGRVHDGDAESLRFATARGFHEVTRDVNVALAVAPGDGAWEPGIVELAPVHLEGAYEVAVEAIPEMALPQIAAAPPFDEWVERDRRDGVFGVVALDAGQVVGYAMLYRVPAEEHELENGLTAVLRSHRRRGIATALKRAQIAWAAEHGYARIVSDSVAGNTGMRAVNERLGYREVSAVIVVERTVS